MATVLNDERYMAWREQAREYLALLEKHREIRRSWEFADALATIDELIKEDEDV